ncbi:MAG: hypothetical protein ACPG5B_02380 [Chitinophagales bacterium]
MKNIFNLLQNFAKAEAKLQNTLFIAPCLLDAFVQTKVNHIIYTFALQQNDFEGFGIFKPLNAKIAKFEQAATDEQIETYLKQFRKIRLLLIAHLQGNTWLAYPTNESEAQQHLGIAKPIVVHLVAFGRELQQIVARYDGKNFWFEAEDTQADFFAIDDLREALQNYLLLEQLEIKGITPEMKTVYEMLLRKSVEKMLQQNNFHENGSQLPSDKKRLERALTIGGGSLQSFTDRGDCWTVEWKTTTGETHSSLIDKKDLRVLSSGICLSDQDERFDLQSLVAVIEQRD